MTMIMSPTIAVVKVYGIRVGKRPHDEWEKYVSKVLADHPNIRYGRFGKPDMPEVIIYYDESYTEMYDNGAGTTESMIHTHSLNKYMVKWDKPVLDAIEDLGYITYKSMDVQWHVAVVEFS